MSTFQPGHPTLVSAVCDSVVVSSSAVVVGPSVLVSSDNLCGGMATRAFVAAVCSLNQWAMDFEGNAARIAASALPHRFAVASEECVHLHTLDRVLGLWGRSPLPLNSLLSSSPLCLFLSSLPLSSLLCFLVSRAGRSVSPFYPRDWSPLLVALVFASGPMRFSLLCVIFVSLPFRCLVLLYSSSTDYVVAFVPSSDSSLVCFVCLSRHRSSKCAGR